MAEIIHDALLREWGLLRQWLKEDRSFKIWHQSIEERSRDWKETNLDSLQHREQGKLLRGRDLVEAESWLNERGSMLFKDERDFIEASLSLKSQEQALRERRRRITLMLFAIGFLTAITLALTAFVQRRNATLQAQLSKSRELAAQSLLQLQVDPELSLLLATKAAEIADTIEAEGALRQALLESRIRVVLSANSTELKSVAFSPDGKSLAITSEGSILIGAITRNGSHTKHEGNLRSLRQSNGFKRAVFSTDGKLIAGVGENSVRVWEFATGEIHNQTPGYDARMFEAGFSADGRLGILRSDGNTLTVFDVSTLRTLRKLPCRDDGQISVSSTGEFVATSSGQWDGLARLWNLKTSKALDLKGHDSVILAIGFSPNTQYLVTAGGDSVARVWETESGRELAVLRGHTAPIFSAVFSPDNELLVTASLDRTARVWEVRTGSLVTVLRGHTEPAVSAAFSYDGKLVTTASADGTCRIWDLTTASTTTELLGHSDDIRKIVFSSDGKSLVTASSDSTARIWDTNSGNSIGELVGHNGPILSAAYTPDTQSIITVGSDKTVRVWKGPATIKETSLEGYTGTIWTAAISRNTDLVLISGQNGSRIYSTSTGALVTEMQGDGLVMGAAFSSDGKAVVTASADNETSVWETQTGKLMAKLRWILNGPMLDAAFSPDGRVILTASADRVARIWDTKDFKMVTELIVPSDQLVPVMVRFDMGFRAIFNPDGRLVVTVNANGVGRVWDLSTRKVIAEMSEYKNDSSRIGANIDNTFSIGFSPDSKFIAIGQSNGITRVYVCDLCGHTADLLAIARERPTRTLTEEERQNYLQ